jgi:hypothetical protein
MARFRSIPLVIFGLVMGSSFWPIRATINPTGDPLTRTRLSAPSDVQGYPCAAGYAWLFFDGRLRECAVSRETKFGEIAVPTGSWINLTHNGDPDTVFLAHDTPINGYLCKGSGLPGPIEGASTALYPSGKLKTCWLASDTVVDGIGCAHASMMEDAFGGGSGTYFHENGRLQACKLSRGAVIDGHAFNQGDHIRLDASGKLALPASHFR